MIKTQASVEAAVLKLWGLVCQDCDGITCAEAAKSEPRGVPRCDEKCCKRCGGTGYSLKEATRETWPFWERAPYHGNDSIWIEHDHNFVFIPDFATDDAAAVKLAERMGRYCAGFHLQQPQSDSEGWTVCGNWGEFSAPTLGAALLAALTAEEDQA